MFAHLQYIGESKETSFGEREITNMNRGAMQSSPVQQITAGGNPNWWNINTMLPPSHHFPPPIPTTNFNFINPPQSPSPFSPPSWPLDNDYNAHTTTTTTTTLQHQTPAADFWTQLFMGGLASEEEKAAAVAAAAAAGLINHFPQHHHSSCGFVYGNNNNNLMAANSTTPTPTFTTSSPHSCITSFDLLEISPTTTTTTTNTKSDPPPPPLTVADPTPECNSSAGNGGSVKKAKVQSTATQFKVRKFGDRITTLHQLVSPFGKTDTASVLLEAIGYVRFLQSQIEALSLPYLSSGSGNNKRQQLQQHPQSVQGKRNCIFPDHEDPGQLLNDICLKRKGGPDQEEAREDLRSRGLCLVPISWTLHVGRDNGADYWAPVLGGFQ